MLVHLLGKRRASVWGVPVIILFTFMTGCTASVVRACVMLVLVMLAPLLGREADGLTSLCAGLLILVVANPLSVAAAGLQLSFAAMTGIILLTPKVYDLSLIHILMSHVSLASLPEYPKLLALSDMTVIIKPNMSQKKEIIRNTADALKAFGYENPKLALLSLVEKVTFHMQDTVEAQRLVSEQKQRPFADCELWGPIAYDLILSKEAARLKNYDCPWSGGGFDGIIAPDLLSLIHTRCV